MSEENEKVDIEQIMNEIRSEIKAKGYSDILEFDDVVVNTTIKFNPQMLNEGVTEINQRCQVNWYREIEGNPIANFIKRIARKFIQFMIAPIVSDQNNFNIWTVRTLSQVKNFIDEKNSIEQLEAKLQADEKMITELRKRIETLEKISK